jgi:hypothetical protein
MPPGVSVAIRIERRAVGIDEFYPGSVLLAARG